MVFYMIITALEIFEDVIQTHLQFNNQVIFLISENGCKQQVFSLIKPVFLFLAQFNKKKKRCVWKQDWQIIITNRHWFEGESIWVLERVEPKKQLDKYRQGSKGSWCLAWSDMMNFDPMKLTNQGK